MSERILRNSAVNLSGQAIYALFHLLSIVVLARALGAAVFGQYYTIFALVLVVQLVAEAGLSTILTSRLVRHPDQHQRIVAEGAGLCLAVCFASAVLMTSLGLAAAWWQGSALFFWAFAAAGLACAALQIQRFCAGVLQAAEVFGYENIARVSQGAVFAGLVLLFVAGTEASLLIVVALFAASHWISAAILVFTLHRRHSLARPSWNLPWKGWLTEGGPLGVGDVIRGITWQLDTVLLGLLQPSTVVGIYSVAYRPLGPLNWVPRAVLSASFPSLTRLSQDRAAIEAAFAQSARVLMIVAIPIAVTIFVAAEPFVLLVAGPEYIEAAVPLRLLIWITVLSFFTMHFRFLMAALGQQRTYAVLVAGVFAIEVLVELTLIPSWSYFGACAGSLLGETVFAVAGWTLCRRAGINGPHWSVLARAGAAGLAMAILLWTARYGGLPVLLPLGAIATALYFAVCVWLGALQKEEIQQFGGAVVRLLRPAPHVS